MIGPRPRRTAAESALSPWCTKSGKDGSETERVRMHEKLVRVSITQTEHFKFHTKRRIQLVHNFV